MLKSKQTLRMCISGSQLTLSNQPSQNLLIWVRITGMMMLTITNLGPNDNDDVNSIRRLEMFI